MTDVAGLVQQLTATGDTVAVAESLTGGALAAEIVAVPGASGMFRGGVIAYATDLKCELLGVDAALLAARGPVDADVASAMASGVRDRLAATYGVATTGVAGPASQNGHGPGTVFVAVAGPRGVVVRSLSLTGDRASVRAQTVSLALGLLAAVAGEHPG